jgi:toxin ParE1/3/4
LSKHLVYVSAEAEADIDSIAEYTKNTWGWRQTDQYLANLEDGFELLALNPFIGRRCDSIRLGLRRFEVGSHIVFYDSDVDGIRIIRVLHERMLPAKPRFEA